MVKKFIFRSLLCLTFLLGGWTVHAQNFNRPVPPGFYPYEFEQLDNSFQGYYFFSTYRWGYWNSGGKMALVDAEGYIAWWTDVTNSTVDFKWLPAHHRFSFIDRKSVFDYRHYHMDTAFALIDSVVAQYPAIPDGHEFLTLDNGNRLILVYQDSTMDLSSYTFNGNQGLSNQTVKGMGIQEFDPQGNMVREWRSLDHIHPSEFVDGYYYVPTRFDYAHANSIAEDTDGHLLVSFRHLDAVHKIHHQTGDVIWRLGGKHSDFSFPNDSLRFRGQHSAARLPNGRIGLFDNGNQKPLPRHTRVVEYDLDTLNWTATLAYSYDANQSIYAPATGNYQHDQPDFRAIGWGDVRRPAPSTSLLNAAGNLVSQFHFEDTVVTYRFWAYALPFALPRPTITCTGTGQSVTLTAPAGHSAYLWSTGQTTPQITVADTGTYQVWVHKGIGMLGSYPLHVTDLSGACGPVNSPSPQPFRPEKDEIVGYYDLKPPQPSV
ncbi:MAG: aryl-sulfate sulfotransferase, partial [Bacteroidota bacterium]